MMRRAAFASALALAAPFAIAAPAHAQLTASPIPVLESGHTLLTVSADGKSTREPDMATFSAGVTTQAQTATQALADNSRKMTQVIAALKRAGIADRDVQTSNLNVSPIYAQPRPRPDGSYPAEEQRITGYQADNSVTVRQRKLGEYGSVIDALVSAGANQVNGPNFVLSEPDEAQDEARVEAMKTARERAQLYARAAGLRVVRVLSISESGGYSPSPVLFARAVAADAPPPAPPPPPVAAGELEVSMRVTVQFELAP